MKDSLKRFFDEQLTPADEIDEYARALGIQYATAALLIGVSKSDSDQDDVELAMINALLQETFDLSDEMLEQILEFADEATAEEGGVDQFAALIKDRYEYPDKKKLIEYLWVVAFADGRLDRYEEQFIQSVATLFGVTDADLREARQAAEDW